MIGSFYETADEFVRMLGADGGSAPWLVGCVGWPAGQPWSRGRADSAPGGFIVITGRPDRYVVGGSCM